ncbi:MAG: hypothetical protein KDA73_08675 [Rhodobacteraceae bacterium]|nr:hypothetical protein [Paracoccaceae bacterium]
MLPINFDTVKDNFLKGLTPLAENLFGDLRNLAMNDGMELWDEIRTDLDRRTQLLAEGKLTREEFDALLKMQAGRIEMHALTAAGLAAARIQRFRTGLISLLINSVRLAL